MAAGVSVGAALLITLWLDVNLNTAPVSILICAVMFSAWLGGYGPGLLATVLSILAFKYYFVPTIHSFAVEVAEIPRVVVFALAAFFVGSLSASQRSATEALREEIRAPLSPSEREEYQREIAKAREKLGEEAFAAALAEGSAMTMAQAIAYALEAPTKA